MVFWREIGLSLVVLAATAGGLSRAAENSRIMFSSDRDGNYEIYVMDSDGSNVVRLTNHPADDFGHGWSPDGRQIIFTSRRDGNEEIYVMDADGSNPKRLTFNGTRDTYPDWSPDGQRIAFTTNRHPGSELYVMNVDGSNQTRLTFDGTYIEDEFPDWSPDGSQLLYSHGFGMTRDVWVMSADGSNPTRLTDEWGSDINARWSPDGSRIAFACEPGEWPTWTYEICVMNADGSNWARLTYDGSHEGQPDWSPDAQRIAFVTDRHGGSDIYVMNADGSDQTRLTHGNSNNQWPRWSSAVSFEFATLSVHHARLSYDEPGSDSLLLRGLIALNDESDGIELLEETVTFDVGSVAIRIPAGSFVVHGSIYEWSGIIDGMAIIAVFEDHGADEWTYALGLNHSDLNGTPNPVTCSLTIGNDWGETTEKLKGRLTLGDGLVVEGGMIPDGPVEIELP